MKRFSAWWFGIVMIVAMSFFSLKGLAIEPIATGAAFATLANPVGTAAVTAAAAGEASLLEAIVSATASESVYARSVGGSALNAVIAATERQAAVSTLSAVVEATIANGVAAAQVAQSGLIIDGILKTAATVMRGGTYLGAAILVADSTVSQLGIETIYDPVSNEFVSLTDFKALSTKPADWINLVPISQTDSSRREYQLKAANLEGCPQSSLLPAMAYCIAGSAAYDVVVYSYQQTFGQQSEDEDEYNSSSQFQRWYKLSANQLKSVVTSFIINDHIWGGNFWGDPISDVKLDSWIVPSPKFIDGARFDLKFTYTNRYGQRRDFDETLLVQPVDGATPCPTGTKFTFNLWEGQVQVCEPDFSQDSTKTRYASSLKQLGSYPHYETYPDGTIKVHPIVSNQISLSSQTGIAKEFSTDSRISSDGSSIEFTKNPNQFVDGTISYKGNSGEVIVSRTLDKFKMKHRNGTDFFMKVREVSKYSTSLQLLSREISYETSDGTKLKPDDTFMSPDTFGSPDLALSPRFGVQSIPRFQTQPQPQPQTQPQPGTDPATQPQPQTQPGTDPATQPQPQPQPQTQPGTDPATQPQPQPQTQPGTGPATQPQPQQSTENVPCGLGKPGSPPCQIDWGKSPTAPEVPTKETEDLIPFFTDLKDHFVPKKELFPVSNRCVNPVVELSKYAGELNVLRPFAKDYELTLYCRALTSVEQVVRLLFMISWFLFALWVVLDA